MDRIGNLSGVSRHRADQGLNALERVSLARIECDRVVALMLADLRDYGA